MSKLNETKSLALTVFLNHFNNNTLLESFSSHILLTLVLGR